MKYKSYLIVLIVLSLLIALFEIEVYADLPDIELAYFMERLVAVFVSVGLIIFGFFIRELIVIGSAALVVNFCSFLMTAAVMEYQSDTTRDRGELIVEALNSYKVDEGQFPSSLTLLKPKYLEVIPSTSIGLSKRSFYYSLKLGRFHLSYSDGFNEPYFYDNDGKCWADGWVATCI